MMPLVRNRDRGSDRIDELLVRYWDDALTEAEADELDRLLADDPTAEERVEAFCLQALAFVERESVPQIPPVSAPAARRHHWLALGFVSGALAAVVVLAVGLRPAADAPNRVAEGTNPVPTAPPAAALAVVAQRGGAVSVNSPQGERPADSGTVIGIEQTISTAGVDSWAVLDLSDGWTLRLSGETVIGWEGEPARSTLFIHRGYAAFHPPSDLGRAGRGQALRLRTSDLVGAADPGTAFEVEKRDHVSEIRTEFGRVQLYKRDGNPFLDVSTGQVVSVDGDGRARRTTARMAGEHYRWDLSRPLPAGWQFGRFENDPTARPYKVVLTPEPELDDQGRVKHWVIASNNRWATGLFRFSPRTRAKLRYKVDRPGYGLVFAASRGFTSEGTTGETYATLMARLHFRGNGWQDIEVRHADWLIELRDRPDWESVRYMAFRLGVLTSESDLGLRIAELTVEPEGSDPTRD